MKELGFNTKALHAGHEIDSTGSRVVPIYQTTSYVFKDADHAAALFDLKENGYIYSRINNPTVAVLEKRMAALEGGVGAVATSSGMAAILYSILNIASVGDEIISVSTLYGGTYTLFKDRFYSQYGIKAHLVDPEDFGAIEKAINPKTKAIFFETIGNPGINIPDIEKLAEIAKRHKVALIADNTFGTPYLFEAKKWGVNIVAHSLTKYLGGHGNSIGGIVIDMGNFDWRASGRYSSFTEPDTTYHNLVYADLPDAYIAKLRVQMLRDTGACLSPFNAFLILQGIETLSLRVERHCANALAVAKYLKNHPQVEWVNYPALEGDQYHERQQKYLPKGAGGILTFGIKGGIQAGKKFINALKLFSLLANVADARSLVIHPASTTHSQLSEEDLKKAAVLPELIRLSIGLEDIKDILDDLDRGFQAAKE
ncbi:MAG: O-acetylhomoserine aminocarboxypropyltransferase/cysteine synthase [Clostridiales bacterium]|nr:O-acetylhomoserine aminocarboxypropyltransferase/cysteine synthase [Clostridiales bacterium]